MRYLLGCLLICCLPIRVRAQLYDAQWVVGPGTSMLDFRVDTVRVYGGTTFMPTTFSNAAICDTWGNLLYYTNGSYISYKDGTKMPNGDTLSPCLYSNQHYPTGLNIPQAVLFVPHPSDSNYYYLFHFSNDTASDTRPRTLYYSLIDGRSNGGRGNVVRKNVAFFNQTQFRGGGLTAVKHANGRDYWLVIGESGTNKYYKFLLQADTIIGPFTQNIGPTASTVLDLSYSKFSFDGSKYATTFYSGTILVADFDRCSGQFSNAIELFNDATADVQHPAFGAISLEFSPNGKYLYACTRANLNQYNLWSSGPQDSVRIWTKDSGDLFQMDMLQNAPNGKLYASTWNGGLEALHVINNPDALGDSCNFVCGGQHTLSINSYNLPNMINYRLGPLVGSGCDTIKTDTTTDTTHVGLSSFDHKSTLRILPNPADKYAYVEMGQQGSYELQLFNEAGQLIGIKQTKQVDIFDTEKLPNGVYIINVVEHNRHTNIVSRQIIVQH